MKFKVRVEKIDGNKHWEDYDKPELKTEAECERWAHDTIKKFNSELRPGELPRKVLRVWTFGASRQHEWRKLSLVTEVGGYDNMQCVQCGVTGRRYGLGSAGVARDKKYQRKKYEQCGDVIHETVRVS